MRMVLGKKGAGLIQKGKHQHLLPVPVDENLAMIYTELGVYAGERLGTLRRSIALAPARSR